VLLEGLPVGKRRKKPGADRDEWLIKLSADPAFREAKKVGQAYIIVGARSPRDYLNNPTLPPEAYDKGESKGWERSKQSARPEFLKMLDDMRAELQEKIEKQRGK
jgi:hypothetical protein